MARVLHDQTALAAVDWLEGTENIAHAARSFGLDAAEVKDVSALEAAYNDAAGVTARFTRNYFARMNRELGSDIDLTQVEHVARWNPALQRMEIFGHFHAAQEVYVEPLDSTFTIAAGERVLIEISRKFRLPAMKHELAKHGFRLRRSFTDPQGWFALLLLERIDDRLMRRAPYPTIDR